MLSQCTHSIFDTFKFTAITHVQTYNALISPIPKRHLLRLSALGVLLSVFELLPSLSIIRCSPRLCFYFFVVCSFRSFARFSRFLSHFVLLSICMNGEHLNTANNMLMHEVLDFVHGFGLVWFGFVCCTLLHAVD